MGRITSILVYRTGHLGDTICAIPAFRLIRSQFPHAELTLLCDAPQDDKVPAREVIESLRIFDRILTYTSGRGLLTAWELFCRVQEVQPDSVVLLPQVRETAKSVRRKVRFFQVWCRVRDVSGFHVQPPYQAWRPNEADRLIQLLNGIGIHGLKPPYDVPVSSSARLAIVQKFDEVGIDPDGRLLIFCGGGKAATQRWSLDRYAAVLRSISEELHWPIVSVGNRAETTAYRAEIVPSVPQLQFLKGAVTLPELFELCRLATAYLGNDTGPMHVAAAVGCPVAVIMSARNAPGMWDPDVEPRLVIRHRTECEDCFLTECMDEQHRCMTSISAERVVAEVIPFLKSLPVRLPLDANKLASLGH